MRVFDHDLRYLAEYSIGLHGDVRQVSADFCCVNTGLNQP